LLHCVRGSNGDWFWVSSMACPRPKRAFDLPAGPDHIVLYQKNIEAVCVSEAEVREQIRLTVIHELGHYFGMDENQLKDV
ncbi:MAG: metallopeptidase family protein, partial [Terriglobales bacterium]